MPIRTLLTRARLAADRTLRPPIKRFLADLRGEPDIDALVRSGLRQADDAFWAPGLYLDPTASVLLRVPTHGPSVNANVLTQDDSLRWHTGHSELRPVELGERNFIGAGSTIMPGVSLGADVIIAAGAVVYEDVPDDSIVGGNPGRVIGKTSTLIERHRRQLEDAPKWSIDEWPAEPTDEERDRLLAAVSAAPVAYRD